MKKYRLFALVLVVSIMTTLLLPFQSLALEPPEFQGKNAILVDATTTRSFTRWAATTRSTPPASPR